MKYLSLLFFLIILGCSAHNKESRIIFPSGGYNFPEKIKPSDSNFCFYPLKSIMPRRDSFNVAYQSLYFLKSFKEPNLSLRPTKEVVFRLTYIDPGGAYILTLTRNNVTIKKWIKGLIFPEQDENKLTELEKCQLNTLRWNFPFDVKKSSEGRQFLADSMLKLYPQLISADYYRSLLDKSAVKGSKGVSFSTKVISITEFEFGRLVELINLSGYWQLPYNTSCYDIPTDAGGFILEANTGIKFNVVCGATCGDKPSNFIKACQEFINIAKLEKEINLFWN